MTHANKRVEHYNIGRADAGHVEAHEVQNGSKFLGKPYEPNAIIKNDMEFILMQRKPGGYRKPTNRQREASRIEKETFDRWFQQIWNIAGASSKNHPAPYPLELATRLVQMFSFTEDTVLDPFCGSGTTMVAALRNGRNSIGIEIDPEYCRMAARYDRIASSPRPALSRRRDRRHPQPPGAAVGDRRTLHRQHDRQPPSLPTDPKTSADRTGTRRRSRTDCEGGGDPPDRSVDPAPLPDVWHDRRRAVDPRSALADPHHGPAACALCGGGAEGLRADRGCDASPRRLTPDRVAACKAG